ncbi:TIM barrel protein [Aquicoccus sp. SCR17]|nr:TIM barrel protein [Carideicomes alvinocaridis]
MARTAIHAGVWSADPAPDNVRRVLELAAECGFDHLALPLRDPAAMDPGALARAADGSGAGLIGTAGMPPGGDIGSDDPERRERGRQHLERVIATARDIGMTQINGALYGPLGHAPRPATRDDMARSAETLGEIADLAAEAGILLCAEAVNRYETSMINTVAQGLAYLELADRPNLRLHVDTYHMAIEERDAPAAARAALPRLGYFELDQSHRGRLDEGSLDLARIAAPVRDGGYDGLIGVEAFARSRLAPGHADALAVWRDHFDDGTALARQARALIREIFETPQDGAAPSRNRETAGGQTR